MNVIQKRLLLIAIVLFELSVLVVPQEWRFSPDASMPQVNFGGYTFIWSVRSEISLIHLFIEWMGILVGFLGLFFYYKD